MSLSNSKSCGNCKSFKPGAPTTVWMPRGSVPANPETVRGKCCWKSPVPLPFWLWGSGEPYPIAGDTCPTWEHNGD